MYNIMKEVGRSIGDPQQAMFLLVQQPWRRGDSSRARCRTKWLVHFSSSSCLMCLDLVLILAFFFHSLTPEIVSTPSSPEEEDKSILNAVVLIDDSVPTTKIQIRLVDGSRLIQRFNSTHR